MSAGFTPRAAPQDNPLISLGPLIGTVLACLALSPRIKRAWLKGAAAGAWCVKGISGMRLLLSTLAAYVGLLLGGLPPATAAVLQSLL
jgi:hypothetical protein